MCRSRLEIKWIAPVLAMAVFGWSSPVSFGQDGGGDVGQTVTLCHVPLGNPEDAQTIVVNQSTATAHLLHDDYLGACLGDDGSADPQDQGDRGQANSDEGEKVIICHVPPGNPGNAHTIEVGAPAAEVHLAHGDFLGACPGEECLSDSDCDDGVACTVDSCNPETNLCANVANDEDGDGVCGDVNQCPGTPPDTDVDSDGCPPGESQQQPPAPDEELCGVCGSGGEMSMAVMLMGLMLMRFGMRRRHS